MSCLFQKLGFKAAMEILVTCLSYPVFDSCCHYFIFIIYLNILLQIWSSFFFESFQWNFANFLKFPNLYYDTKTKYWTLLSLGTCLTYPVFDSCCHYFIFCNQFNYLASNLNLFCIFFMKFCKSLKISKSLSGIENNTKKNIEPSLAVLVCNITIAIDGDLVRLTASA
jgi:hypothetical protein